MDRPRSPLVIPIFVFSLLVGLLTGCEPFASSNSNSSTPTQTESPQQKPDTSTGKTDTNSSSSRDNQQSTDTSRNSEAPSNIDRPGNTDPAGQPDPPNDVDRPGNTDPAGQPTPLPSGSSDTKDSLNANSSNKTDPSPGTTGIGNTADTNNPVQLVTPNGTSNTGSSATPKTRYVPAPIYVTPRGTDSPQDTACAGKSDCGQPAWEQ